MAGIGFQLRRVIGKGGLGGVIGAVVSGVFVVAGPWLISIVSIFAIRMAFASWSGPSPTAGAAGLTDPAGLAGADAFQAGVIYCYAASLALFAAAHHLFTRLVADLVWERREGEATAWFLRFMAGTALASAALAVPAVLLLPFGGAAGSPSFRLGLALLFIAVNLVWVAVLYGSLVRRHIAIMAAFAFGMALAVGSTILLGFRHGPGGALLGFALGHLAVAGAVTALALGQHPPKRPAGGIGLALGYARRYRHLLGAGGLFFAGQWADKVALWFLRGSRVPGTPFMLFEAYDFPVYLAGLSVVPGLVYFIVYAETRLYTDLRHFLHCVSRETLRLVIASRQRLKVGLVKEIQDQSLLQAASTTLLLGLYLLVTGDSQRFPALAIAAAASYFQFTLLTLLSFLYYFERYAEAFACAGLYFAINALAGNAAYALLPWLAPGVTHCVAGALASLLAYRKLLSSIDNLDRLMFRRSMAA